MRRNILNTCLIGTALNILPFTAAYGQDAKETATKESTVPNDVIVVTAQKRSERLTDVPMSITAITGDGLTRIGISEPSQLGQAVPGFSAQQSAFGTPILSIRGIGYNDNSATAGSTVTAYIDQVALPYSVMARGAIMDLERVEVLKGPQGTLFGMNSTGGAINFVAARPTNDFEAGIDLSFGRFNEIDTTAFISGPLTDTLTARAAVQIESASGWQYSTTRPDDRLGDKEFINGRLLIDWKASPQLTFQLGLSAWHDGSENQAAQFVQFSPAVPVTPLTQFVADAMSLSPAAGNNPREADWDPDTDLARSDDFRQISLRADWDLTDDIVLTSITAYSDFRGDSPIDIDGTAFNAFLVEEHDTKLISFSQELRVAGTSGPIDWMIGGNYQDEIANETTRTVAQGTNSQVGPFFFSPLGQVANQSIDTISVFGSLDFHVTEQLTLQGSLRYASQNRDFNGCIRDAGAGAVGVSAADAFSFLATVFAGSPTIIPAGGCVTLDATTFAPGLANSSLDEDNLSWRLGADYSFNDNAMLYANVTRGYKSGSYALVPAILSSQFTPVTQESVLAFEAGTRLSTIDNKFSIEFAAFYNEYEDKQLKGIVLTPVFGPLPQLVNIPESEVYGVEVNMVARPFEGLRLSTGITYVASEVLTDPVAPAEPRDPFGVLTSYVGESFPNTPEWQIVSDAEYEFPIGASGLQGFVGGSVTYRSSSPAAFGNNPVFLLPSSTLVDLRAGIETADKHWTAQIWGRNVTNEHYWTNVTHLTDYVSRLTGTPATYGISVSYRY